MNVAIVSAVRSPVGRGKKGALTHTRGDDLAAQALSAALGQVAGLGAERVEDITLGCAMPEGQQGLNIARNAVFLAGLPDTVPAQTLNRFCSSGLQAQAAVAQAVACGQFDVGIAGGVESMSAVPMGGHEVSLNPRLQGERAESYISMGHTAERVASRFEVSREAQDDFAVRSHERAAAAADAGRFEDELFVVKARGFAGGKTVDADFLADECLRRGTTREGLAGLRPVFRRGGTVTAGNSSPLSDGAAASVIMSDAAVAEFGVSPLGRMRAFQVVGVAPDIMGIGPVPAIRRLLERAELSIDDISLFEINEAFAAQAVYCQRELGIADDQLNVNGGAIALGHPLGCTGAKLSATLLHELRRRGGGLGVVSMCIGGGMGAAGLFEVSG